jgi:hypothetical protein
LSESHRSVLTGRTCDDANSSRWKMCYEISALTVFAIALSLAVARSHCGWKGAIAIGLADTWSCPGIFQPPPRTLLLKHVFWTLRPREVAKGSDD